MCQEMFFHNFGDGN